MADYSIPDEITIIPLPTQREPSEDYDPLLGDEAAEDTRISRAINARLSEVKTGLTTFLAQIDTLLKDTATVAGEFSLDEVEVSAGVTAGGKFVLFGVGAEGSLDGGIRFVFKRNAHGQLQAS